MPRSTWSTLIAASLLMSLWHPANASSDPPPGLEGRRLFTAYCQLCHGPDGKGDGPLAVKRDIDPPDLTFTVRSQSDTSLRKIISGTGRNNTTGRVRHEILSDTMPAWQDVFDDTQMDALIAYLRLLSTSKHDLMGKVDDGFRVYQRYCQTCHGEDGSGDGVMTKLMAMEPMDHTNAVVMDRISNDEMIQSILNGKGSYMPAWEGILSRDEVEALVSYIRLLAQ